MNDVAPNPMIPPAQTLIGWREYARLPEWGVTHIKVKPGEPVCHLAVPRRQISSIRKALKRAGHESLTHRLRSDLATNLRVDSDTDFEN